VETIEPDSQGVIDPGDGVHRHLRVLRAAAGEIVFLFDGRGKEVEAEITAIDDDAATLRVLGEVRAGVESRLDTCLVQAIPVRSGRMETIVRQATELGVHRIVPVIGQRSRQSKSKDAAQQRRAERWRRVADSAAEQCGRTRVPLIDSPCRFDELSWETLPRPLLIADPGASVAARGTHDGTPAGTLDARATATAATVLVGPEGGWTGAEVEAVLTLGGETLQLGPRELRADSAGVVAITLLQYLWGDLRRGREGAR
jgi:16S rRNA (uracil1498-N3)-methyltransferase